MRKTDLSILGSGWLADEVAALTDTLERMLPSDYNEQNRYLPDSVTPMPGFIRYDINPFMVEILDCADPRSHVREVNLLKGVQITYTTLLESILLYYIDYVKTRPCMMVSADKELVKGRIENYILPMLQQSEKAHLIRSADEGNTRKTGKTANHLQWDGGGFLIPAGANNADKMRMWSIMLMLKDEIDAWPDTVGKDGDPDSLTDDRCSAFWEIRKIFRGGTPLILDTSKIYKQYRRGDQREYRVLCRKCNYPQKLKWETINKDNGIVGGIKWDMDGGTLILDSVRYVCSECGHEHFEHDKTKLFSLSEGAHWHPTANPVEPGIRSYHLPALYSPYGFASWAKCVGDYLKGFDPVEKKVKDVTKYQVFYNNILGWPFEVRGVKVQFEQVSAHRRQSYKYGEIPNTYAEEHSGSIIQFLTCKVDVHKDNLAVAVTGWTKGMRSYLINYWRFEDDDCTQPDSPVWQRLRELIEETTYTSDDGKEYRITCTLIDAGYENDTVVKFCSQYSGGVFPILGRDRPSKNQKIDEFAPFKTRLGTQGFRIIVDHYKDRIAPVLRREWDEGQGVQRENHWNAPVDATDKQLKELTVETRRKKVDDKGSTTYYWHRPSNSKNELWDLTVYGHASVEIIAWQICIEFYELDRIDWDSFWSWVDEHPFYKEVSTT